MSLTIREPATEDERAATVDILHELWTDESRDRVASFLDEPGYHALSAFDDGTVMGVAGVSIQRALHHERHAWIHDLVVTESRRGCGIGSQLLDAVEDWARERDLELVALATIENNDDAREFYDENEYTEWGRIAERRL